MTVYSLLKQVSYLPVELSPNYLKLPSTIHISTQGLFRFLLATSRHIRPSTAKSAKAETPKRTKDPSQLQPQVTKTENLPKKQVLGDPHYLSHPFLGHMAPPSVSFSSSIRFLWTTKNQTTIKVSTPVLHDDLQVNQPSTNQASGPSSTQVQIRSTKNNSTNKHVIQSSTPNSFKTICFDQNQSKIDFLVRLGHRAQPQFRRGQDKDKKRTRPGHSVHEGSQKYSRKRPKTHSKRVLASTTPL